MKFDTIYKSLFEKSIIALLVFVFTSNSEALTFKPLTAAVFEPRIGSFYQFDSEKLRLDIGTSVDLKTFESANKDKISIGADFMTYTRLRTAGNFKFPVETSDYYFGLNTCITDSMFNLPFSYRIRFAHISSHLVDGYSDTSVFKKEPFVYSREFIDLLAAVQLNDFRVYAGVNILYSVKPKNFLLLNPQIGADYEHKLLNWLSACAGYDFRYVGISHNLYPVHNAQAGLKFITDDKVGLFLGAYYCSGKSMHGLFFNDVDNYFGIGFQIMFY
jgi:hypothetical protein